MKLILTVFAGLAVLGAVLAQSGLAPKKFNSIPLGKIKPSGWLVNQLNLQTNGLAGHEHQFYNYISQTTWMGGNALYSDLEEAGSYWFNGMVPTGILANNSEVNQKTAEFLKYVLDHQDSTGWLGPEVNTTKPKYLWGRYPFLFGAIQMVENDPSLTDQVLSALYKFIELANSMIKSGQGLEQWGEARWQEFVISLQWLYDYHPQGNEDLLLDTMQRLKSTGYPWDKIFSEQYFPTAAVDNVQNPLGLDIAWHGVNVAEGLKALPAGYRFSKNRSDLDAASEAWDRLFKFHGRPSGIFAADEYLAGLGASRGTELCLVVEAMHSGSFLYQVAGDLKYADRVERITYNALPATLTGGKPSRKSYFLTLIVVVDMWSRQYLQQRNQVASKNMNPNPFPRDGPYSNVFGLEPNYPCCTVNFPQGWPKFVSNAFVTTPDGGSLVDVFLGPFDTSVTLASGNQVRVVVDTQYPFSDILKFTVEATQAFTYFVRVPAWVVGGTIAINNGEAKALEPANGLQAVSIQSGTTRIVLTVPAPITIEARPGGSIAVHRGPLNYAFDIPRNETVLKRNSQQPLAVDLQFDSTASWQYAIDPATLKFEAGPSPSTLPSPIFDSGQPPLSISVLACPISWPLAGDTFARPPPTGPNCTGPPTTIKLTPYGSTKLRISEFPVFQSA